MWDVSGQATRLWKHYFDKIDAVIFVIDSNDAERLTKAKVLLHRCINDRELAKAPILIYANKQDIEGCMTKDEIYGKLDVQNVIDSGARNDICYQECSAKTSDGIWEGMKQLFESVAKAQQKAAEQIIEEKESKA